MRCNRVVRAPLSTKLLLLLDVVALVAAFSPVSLPSTKTLNPLRDTTRPSRELRALPLGEIGNIAHQSSIIDLSYWTHHAMSTLSTLNTENFHRVVLDAVQNPHHHNNHLGTAPHHHLANHFAQNKHHTSASSRGITSLVQSYNALLLSHPVSTKAITASFLGTVSDAIAQKFSQDTTTSPYKYDLNRGVSFAIFGAMYTGAFQHYWFEWLNNNLSSILSSASLSPTMLAMAKLSANQFIMVPIVYMPLFLCVTSALMGLSLQETAGRFKESYVSLLLRCWFFWLPAQSIQFLFIDPEWQISYVCAAGLIWTTILSLSSAPSSSASSSSSEPVNVPSLDGERDDESIPLSRTSVQANMMALSNDINKKSYVGIMSQGFVW